MNENIKKIEAKLALGLPLTEQEKTDYILSNKTFSTNPCDHCNKNICYGCPHAEEEEQCQNTTN